ncbi:MAG: twin-arginine translocation signal domain-containing protein, partial [Candidatus Omnitrophica bacterium]|nr:twin-arginine translocation signal domain-containing protein [Candidatus Omnitrophota bacterium]
MRSGPLLKKSIVAEKNSRRSFLKTTTAAAL